MTTRHRKRAKHYTVLSSETIRDPALYLRSLGLITVILNLPDDWVVRADNLAASRIEGRDAVAACLRNLAEAGYYRVERRRLLNGRFQMGTAIAADKVPEWAAEYKEFAGKPIPLVQQPDGTFKVRRKDGRLTDDGFVGEFHPNRKDFPMPGEIPGQTEHGFSGSGQNDHEIDDHEDMYETDISGPGIPGSDVPASGERGPISTTETYCRDVRTDASSPREIASGLLAVGELPTDTREAPAPAANRKDHLGREAWRVYGLLPHRYRDGLPREFAFPMVHAIRQAFYERFEAPAVLRYAEVCASNAAYAQDKHLPLLRQALQLMRQDARMGLVCKACGIEPGDPFGPMCHLCRPDRVDLTDSDLADLEAARAWLERGDEAEPLDDGPATADPQGPQESPGAAQDGARLRGATERPRSPYSEPDGDLRGARGASDSRGDGNDHNRGAEAPAP